MTRTIEARVRRELRPEEKLLWAGRPRRGLLSHPVSVLLIVAILAIAGLIGGIVAVSRIPHAIRVIEIITVAAREKFTITGLISGLFILLGVVAIWGFVFYPLQRRRTAYALTDQRAVIIPGLSRHKAKSLELSSINFLALTRRRRNRATVLFGEYPDDYAEMDFEQKQKTMEVWKWFGYRFDEFEICQSAGSRARPHRRPVFGRFECIENPRHVYDILKAAAKVKRTESDGTAASKERPIAPFVEGVVKSPGVITFVIDASGSMDGKKLDQAKRGLAGALNMAENNQVGLVVFNSAITARIPVAPLARNRHDLTEAIGQMEASALTALYDALKEAISMTDSAAGDDEGVRAVLVLTDGYANLGKTRLDDIIVLRSRQGTAISCSGIYGEGATDADGRKVDTKDVLGCGLAMGTGHQVQVYFVGIGDDADMEIGRLLAEATGGRYDKGIVLQPGRKVERVRRVGEVDIARVLEEFKYF